MRGRWGSPEQKEPRAPWEPWPPLGPRSPASSGEGGGRWGPPLPQALRLSRQAARAQSARGGRSVRSGLAPTAWPDTAASTLLLTNAEVARVTSETRRRGHSSSRALFTYQVLYGALKLADFLQGLLVPFDLIYVHRQVLGNKGEQGRGLAVHAGRGGGPSPHPASRPPGDEHLQSTLDRPPEAADPPDDGRARGVNSI